MYRLLAAALLLLTQPAFAGDLLDPTPTLSAPAEYKVKFETTAGNFVIKVETALAPNGSDRLYELVQRDFYTEVALFRVIDGFVAQFGIHGDPEVAAAWRMARIVDDPVVAANRKKTLTFAMAGPNTRTTQLFINLKGNTPLDDMGFAPIGKVVGGWGTVKKLYDGYGEGAPRGNGPDQSRVQAEGNAYLQANFPRLDYILSAEVL